MQFQDVYMQIARHVATLSYCKKRQVGAVVVKGRNIVSYGFNGTIDGMHNCCEDREGRTLPNVIHAEMNAVIKAGAEARDADMFITLFPCNECCKLMSQAGIRRVFYLEDHKTDERRLHGMRAVKLEVPNV